MSSDADANSKPAPVHDTPILGMKTRPRVTDAAEYGNDASWWVEYPNGLIDLSRLKHLDANSSLEKTKGQVDVEVDGDRTIRVDASKSALVVIDMQK